MAIQTPDSQAFSAALNDTELEARVRKIVNQSIRDYEWVMEFGSERERIALMKSTLPNLIRALNQRDEQARNEEQAAAYQRLREAFRANVKERKVDE